MTYYEIKWTTSRAQDSYGYNIATLINTNTGDKYKTCGGGYDMTGTVLGDMLTAEHQTAIYKKRFRAHYRRDKKAHKVTGKDNALYGMTHDAENKRVYLDGACGECSMYKIASECGVKIECVYDRSKRNCRLIGYNVEAA